MGKRVVDLTRTELLFAAELMRHRRPVPWNCDRCSRVNNRHRDICIFCNTVRFVVRFAPRMSIMDATLAHPGIVFA